MSEVLWRNGQWLYSWSQLQINSMLTWVDTMRALLTVSIHWVQPGLHLLVTINRQDCTIQKTVLSADGPVLYCICEYCTRNPERIHV